MNLLAAAFPHLEVFAASVAQATAIGAALAIHKRWNTKTIPGDMIELKYYALGAKNGGSIAILNLIIMTKKFIKRSICVVYLLFFCSTTFAQTQQAPKLWHNKEREIHYYPDGGDIVIVNGKHRFNRAIYEHQYSFQG